MRSLAVVIHGSPRRGGNTDTLLGQLVRGIQSTAPDVSVKEIHTSQMKIGPCRECRACDTTGCCIVDDDMQQLYPVLPEADILILSSPIFFYSLSGWAKALVDRCQALWAKKYLLHKPLSQKQRDNKSGWFIAVGATKGKRLFEGSELTAKYFFDALDTSYKGSLLVRGVDRRGDILHHEEELERAFMLGCRIGQETLANPEKPQS